LCTCSIGKVVSGVAEFPASDVDNDPIGTGADDSTGSRWAD